ncbi:hypothetical protein [Nitrospirillum amazonense]|uniref:hypothetical protein n=1 Tax=Nitrospirillum amazonense TaxID=28077 RepID=UPI002412D846|nr:hypothetical protein [Nitrospirillum amazonense]MDG3442480.1 hypothetical protein [Nitrospirillum amazonense]
MPRLDHRPSLERVRAARADAYPELGDVIDALCAGVEALAAGQPLPPETQAVLARRQLIKTRYPKSDR